MCLGFTHSRTNICGGKGRVCTLLVSNIRKLFMRKNNRRIWLLLCAIFATMCVCAYAEYSFEMFCSTDGRATINLETQRYYVWYIYILYSQTAYIKSRGSSNTLNSTSVLLLLLYCFLMLCSLSSRSYCYCCRLNICAALKCVCVRLNLNVIFEWTRRAFNCITHVLDEWTWFGNPLILAVVDRRGLAFSAFGTFECVCLKARDIMRLCLLSMNFRLHHNFFFISRSSQMYNIPFQLIVLGKRVETKKSICIVEA